MYWQTVGCNRNYCILPLIFVSSHVPTFFVIIIYCVSNILEFRHVYILKFVKHLRYIDSQTHTTVTVHMAPDFLRYLLFLLEYLWNYSILWLVLGKVRKEVTAISSLHQLQIQNWGKSISPSSLHVVCNQMCFTLHSN